MTGLPKLTPSSADLLTSTAAPWTAGVAESASEDTSQFVGAVENGRFRRMFPPWINERYLRLTTVSVKDDAGPEVGEIDLGPYDGSILRVLGHYQDGWIYSANIVEQVSESILGLLARQVFPDPVQ